MTPAQARRRVRTELAQELRRGCVFHDVSTIPGVERWEVDQVATEALLIRAADLARAARTYFDRYCQDEAADDGPENTGCSQQQHLDARALKEALEGVPGQEQGGIGSSRDFATTTGSSLDAATTERPEYYAAWLRNFEEAREIALGLSFHHYHVSKPAQGWPTVEQLREAATADQWRRLMDHALAFACLDGNAFPDLIEQYVPEAWVSIMWNGWADGKEFPALDGYSQTGDHAPSRAPQVERDSSREDPNSDLPQQTGGGNDDGGLNTIEVGKPLPYFCPACQAIPRYGFCNLKGCPTAPRPPGGDKP